MTFADGESGECRRDCLLGDDTGTDLRSSGLDRGRGSGFRADHGNAIYGDKSWGRRTRQQLDEFDSDNDRG